MDAAHRKHPQHRSTGSTARLVDGEVQDVTVDAVVLGSIVATLTRSDIEDGLPWCYTCYSGPGSTVPLERICSINL